MDKNQELLLRMVTANSRIDALYDTVARHKKMRCSTFTLLYALSDGQPHSQKDICTRFLVPKTTLNTTIKDCQREGYLELKRVPGTRREMAIQLTPAGKVYSCRMLADLVQAENRAIEETTAQYGEDFIAALECFARRLESHFYREILDAEDA